MYRYIKRHSSSSFNIRQHRILVKSIITSCNKLVVTTHTEINKTDKLYLEQK